MKILFKSDSTADHITVGMTNFKQHYPFVEGSMVWDEFKTVVRQATQAHVLPFIGEAMYAKLAADYTAGELSSEKAAIVAMLQDSIAHYAIYTALPYMPFVVSSSGIQKQQPTEGAVAMTHGERKDTRWNAHIDADSFLDGALKLLENTEGSYWQPWRDHAAKQFKTSAFFKNADDLDEHLNIQGSRRAYINMVSYLKKTEESAVEWLLGYDLFEALKNPSDEAVMTTLLRKVRKFVAQQSLYEAVPFLTLVIEGDGFKIVSRGDGIEERNGLKHQQHENAILRLQEAARQRSEQFKTELIEFLWKNKAKLPL